MRITLTGKNIEITNGIRSAVEKKMSKLDRYFQENTTVNVTLSVQKNRQFIEVTIPFAGTIIRAEEHSVDMYESIDNVLEVIIRQIRKHKTKLQRKIHSGDTIRFDNFEYLPIESEQKIVRTKRFAMKPMNEEEAVLQMELLNHGFYVFRNADTNEVNVVYKRKDGNYGLIEPEF